MKRYHFHFLNLFVFTLLFSVLCPHKSHAALTKQLSYQGRLNDASGQPVPNGTYSITFSIYNVASGGVPLWTETQNVQVDKGGFSAYLGSVTPLNLLFNEDYFLGIKVGSDPEMTPRLKLAIVGTAAFALEAGNAGNAGNAANLGGQPPSNFAPAIHNHDGLYSSLTHTHTPTGVTQIVAGTNVTISPVGGIGVVTINASGGGGGTPLTPAATVSAIGASNSVGIFTSYAREDHAHGIPPSTITGGMLAGNTITDLNIASTAGIATSKLSGTISAIPGNGLGALATMNAVGSPQIADNSIALADIAQNGCTSGQIMKYNGSAWACDVDLTGGGGGVLFNPTSTQMIVAGNAATTPLLLKGAATPSVPVFDVQDSTSASLVKVGPTGNLLVGNPGNTGNAKLSVEDTALGNVIYTAAKGGGNAIYATTTGTGRPAMFEVNNVSNSSPVILGITTGTGNLLQLQQGGVDKFVVDNGGNVAVSGGAAYVYQTGAGNNAGYFEISNASNADAAVYGKTNGTGMAGYFNINNATNSSSIIYGNTGGTGPLLQLQKLGVDKFVVDNAGNITVGGAANTVKNNPSANQTIQPTADVVPLIIKDDAAATANLFDIQNNGGTSLVKVSPTGNLLVGNAGDSIAKVRVNETGTTLGGGRFEINNVSNVNTVVYASTTGNGELFWGNANGTGNLMRLQVGAVDKFVVDNAGNITVGGVANAVKTNPTGTQTILAGNATTTPLVVKAAASPSVNMFDVQDNASATMLAVNSAGSVVIGGPPTTAHQLNIGTNSGSLIIYGNQAGGGNLMALAQGGLNKFLVQNNGDISFGSTVPSIIASGVGANITLNANDAGASTVTITNSGVGTAKLSVEGGIDFGGNLSKVGAGTTTLDIQNAGNTTLDITNTGAGNASLTVEGALVLTSVNGVITNPAASQSITAASAGVTPLSVQAAATPTAPIFNVFDSGAVPFVQVAATGNLLVGNPSTTTAKVSAEETGTANSAGYFKINNASSTGNAVSGSTNGTGNAVSGSTNGSANAIYGFATGTGNAISGFTTGAGPAGWLEISSATNTSAAVYVTTSGTGNAGQFAISNASNASAVIKGNTAGTGNLLQLQQGAVDKFVVSNTGNLTLNGNILAYNGTNSVPVTENGTQQLILLGNNCEGGAGDQTVSLTFTPNFGAVPRVFPVMTTSSTGYVQNVPTVTAAGATINLGGAQTGTLECLDWIAIGNK